MHKCDQTDIRIVPNRFLRVSNVTAFDLTKLYTLRMESDSNHEYLSPRRSTSYRMNHVTNSDHQLRITYKNNSALNDNLFTNSLTHIDNVQTVLDNIKDNIPLYEGISYVNRNKEEDFKDKFITTDFRYIDGNNDYYTAVYMEYLCNYLKEINMSNYFKDFSYQLLTEDLESISTIENRYSSHTIRDSNSLDESQFKKSMIKRSIEKYEDYVNDHDLNNSFDVLIESFNKSSDNLFPMESVIECSSISMLSSNALKEFIKYLYEKNDSLFKIINDNDGVIEKNYPIQFCENSNIYRSYIRESIDQHIINQLYNDHSIIDEMITTVLDIDLISNKAHTLNDYVSVERYIDQTYVFCKNVIEKTFSIKINNNNQDDPSLGISNKLIFWLLNKYHSFNEPHIMYFFNIPYMNYLTDDILEDIVILLKGYNIKYTLERDIPKSLSHDDIDDIANEIDFRDQFKTFENINFYKSHDKLPCDEVINDHIYYDCLDSISENASRSIKMMIAFEESFKELSQNRIMDFENINGIFDTDTFNEVMNKTLPQLYREGYRKLFSLKMNQTFPENYINREAIAHSKSNNRGIRNYIIPYEGGTNPDDAFVGFHECLNTCISLQNIVVYNIRMNIVDKFIHDIVRDTEYNYSIKDKIFYDENNGYNISAIMTINQIINNLFVGNIVINKTMVDQINMECNYLINFIKDYQNDCFRFTFDSIEYFKKFTSLIKLMMYGMKQVLLTNMDVCYIDDIVEISNIAALFEKKIKLQMMYRKDNNRFKLQYNVDNTEDVLEKLYKEACDGDIFSIY